VTIKRSSRPVSAARIRRVARGLLAASELCAIATASRGGRPHVNTAYFAWAPDFRIVWISEPHATHSRNLRRNSSAAVAVYDSSQSWGKQDRGIQLFGTARELTGDSARDAKRIYAGRFPDYREAELAAYLPYELRPSRMKLFEEQALGAAVFVTARVDRNGGVTWERTEVYEPA
jgi:uncharacterized protein YhbP (UPF0306 family)